jgi:UDP-N-acetylglucosamine acyltransferase
VSRISDLAFIGEGVELGENVTVGPGATLLGPCTVEDNVYIGAGAQIGAPPEISSLPQMAAWVGELEFSGVHIQQGAVIREGAVIHQGSYRATTIGRESWILNRAYIAHDVIIGGGTTVSAGVSIGGHCVIDESVNIGMNAAVHQRRIIACGAMVGMNTPVTRDVPPFAKAFGTPPRIHGINTVILERSGFDGAIGTVLLQYYKNANYLANGEWLPDVLLPITDHLDWWRSHNDLKPMAVFQAASQ